MGKYHEVLILYAYFFNVFQVKNISQKNSKRVKNVHMLSMMDVFIAIIFWGLTYFLFLLIFCVFSPNKYFEYCCVKKFLFFYLLLLLLLLYMYILKFIYCNCVNFVQKLKTKFVNRVNFHQPNFLANFALIPGIRYHTKNFKISEAKAWFRTILCKRCTECI